MAAITPRASGFWEDLTMARGYSNDPESLDASDPDEGPDRRTPLDKTIDRIGMGSYQWTLLSLCGFGWMADNMWIQAVAIILPRIQQHYSVPDNYIGVVSSSLFAGMMIGAVGWGTCSDLLGRIAAFNATLFFTSIFGLAASFANSFTTLCISLFLLGTAVGGSMPTDGTLLLEHMPKNKQYLVTALSVFFSVGAVLSAVVGLLVLPQNSCIPTLPCDPDTQNKGWKYLLISLGLITLTMFLARMVFFRLHESPRYLVHAGRPHDAVRSLQMISRFNGFEMPIELADVSDHLHAVENRQESRTAASNDTDSRTILSDGTGENSPPAPGTSSLGSNSFRKANLATPYASTGGVNHGLERHTFQPTRLDHLQNTASSTSHKEEDTDDVHEPLLVNAQRRVDDGNPSSAPVAQGRPSYFGSNTCSTWPGWMRNPLLAWLDRVATVLAPEWLRTTLLVWSAWCAMSLAYTMFNVFLPKLLETRTNGGGTRSLEQSLWDVVIFTIGGCPGALVGAYLIESSVGRRWSLAGSTFLTAFFCLVFAFVSSTWAVRMSTVGISLSATAMWAILYGWTPEIFSTNVRGTACGIASALSRVGGMIAPLLGGILLVISQSLPVYTSVLTFAIAGFCVLLLKENAGESGKRLVVARGVVH